MLTAVASVPVNAPCISIQSFTPAPIVVSAGFSWNNALESFCGAKPPIVKVPMVDAAIGLPGEILPERLTLELIVPVPASVPSTVTV
jgi:hypothetical protein